MTYIDTDTPTKLQGSTRGAFEGMVTTSDTSGHDGENVETHSEIEEAHAVDLQTIERFDFQAEQLQQQLEQIIEDKDIEIKNSNRKKKDLTTRDVYTGLRQRYGNNSTTFFERLRSQIHNEYNTIGNLSLNTFTVLDNTLIAMQQGPAEISYQDARTRATLAQSRHIIENNGQQMGAHNLAKAAKVSLGTAKTYRSDPEFEAKVFRYVEFYQPQIDYAERRAEIERHTTRLRPRSADTDD